MVELHKEKLMTATAESTMIEGCQRSAESLKKLIKFDERN
jgi:hypothetical protein